MGKEEKKRKMTFNRKQEKNRIYPSYLRLTQNQEEKLFDIFETSFISTYFIIYCNYSAFYFNTLIMQRKIPYYSPFNILSTNHGI